MVGSKVRNRKLGRSLVDRARQIHMSTARSDAEEIPAEGSTRSADAAEGSGGMSQHPFADIYAAFGQEPPDLDDDIMTISSSSDTDSIHEPEAVESKKASGT